MQVRTRAVGRGRRCRERRTGLRGIPHAFHAADRLKHKGRLAHSSFALYHDILPGFYVSPEGARELRSAAEILAVDCFPVLERIHDLLLLTVLHYAVLHNKRIVPNCVIARKGPTELCL